MQSFQTGQPLNNSPRQRRPFAHNAGDIERQETLHQLFGIDGVITDTVMAARPLRGDQSAILKAAPS
jgi:hypothetical protein